MEHQSDKKELEKAIEELKVRYGAYRPTAEDIYEEMGKYKHAHLKFEQRLGFIQDVLDEILGKIETTESKGEEARIFERDDICDSLICRMNDAIMKVMISYSDWRREIRHCCNMNKELNNEPTYKIISAERDYLQERLDIFKNNK